MKIHRLANDIAFSSGPHLNQIHRRPYTITMAPLPPPPPPPVTLPSSHPVPSAKTTDTLLTKSQKFIEEHKLLVLGAAVLAVSGAGYYLYSSSAAANKPRARIEKDSSSDEEETGAAAGVAGKSEKKKKKKSSKSKSKKKTADSSLDRLSKSEESPLLEERDAEEVKRILERKRAKEQEAGVKTQGTQGGELNVDNVTDKSTPATAPASTSEPPVPSYLEGIPRTKEEIAKLPSSERKTLATTLKTRGNKLYGAKKYNEAVACYTKALEVAEKEEAVFYSNRAACYQNMTPPNYDQVVKDCDSALRLDSGYVKALNRRATAYEALGRDEEALRDFTATTIMEKFQNDAASTSVERVLKKIASKKAEEMLSTREPRLPSKTFVSAYLGAFRPRE
jgi:import receptor subunit TOM70